jgi:hypothetical protein
MKYQDTKTGKIVRLYCRKESHGYDDDQKYHYYIKVNCKINNIDTVKYYFAVSNLYESIFWIEDKDIEDEDIKNKDIIHKGAFTDYWTIHIFPRPDDDTKEMLKAMIYEHYYTFGTRRQEVSDWFDPHILRDFDEIEDDSKNSDGLYEDEAEAEENDVELYYQKY